MAGGSTRERERERKGGRETLVAAICRGPCASLPHSRSPPFHRFASLLSLLLNSHTYIHTHTHTYTALVFADSRVAPRERRQRF